MKQFFLSIITGIGSVFTTDVTANNLPQVPKQNKTYEVFKAEDDYYKQLSEIKSLSDIIALFKQAETDIGRTQLICSKLLYYIHSQKVWKRLGYTHESDFIRDMKHNGIGTRQNYYLMVKTGEMVNMLSTMSFYHSLTQDQYEKLCRSYSKFPILHKLFEDKICFPFAYDEILEHFLNDTHREFSIYADGLLKKYKYRVNKKPEASDKKKQVNQVAKKSFAEPNQIILSEDKNRLYEEISIGYKIVFLLDYNKAFIDSIETHLKNLRLKKEEKYNGNDESASIRDYYLNDLFLSKFLDNISNIFNEFHVSETKYSIGFGGMVTRESIKRIFSYKACSEMELTLIKACLLHRIDTSPELRKEIAMYGVSSSKEFALKIFEIDISQFKRLKRIGKNMWNFNELHSLINPTKVGSLEKIYFLDVALENHQKDKVIDCFNNLPARQFRTFARNRPNNLKSITMSNKVQKKFLPISNMYDDFISNGRNVSFIGIREDWELEKLKQLLSYNGRDPEKMKTFYPDINWSDASDGEYIITN